jgi:hypothetical protein
MNADAFSVRRVRRPACPRCGVAERVVHIEYGLPAPEMIEQAKRGEIALGGCSIANGSPNWYCKGCGFTFDAPES